MLSSPRVFGRVELWRLDSTRNVRPFSQASLFFVPAEQAGKPRHC
jgi:hypothetical protein